MRDTGTRFDPDTQFAALQERVHGLGQQFLHFEQATTRGFQQVESAIALLSTEVRAGGKTQWQTIVTAIGVLVGILGALGTLAYLPIKTGMEGLASETRTLRDAVVPRAEHVERWRRTDEEIHALVPRAEHEAHRRGAEREAAHLQRQLDDLKRAVAR